MKYLVKLSVESEESSDGLAAVLRTVLVAHAIECKVLSVEKQKGVGE